MSNRPFERTPLPAATAPLFAQEINEGAILASIAAAIIVVGVVICSIVNKGEAQSAGKKPPPERPVALLQR